MCLPGEPAHAYDVLVFHQGGTGFIELYPADSGFTEHFEWSVEPTVGVRLKGTKLTQLNPGRSGYTELTPTLNAVVSFSVEEEDVGPPGRMRVLRFPTLPWPGMSERYLFYRVDIPRIATFQAPCFAIAEERPDDIFRGSALSDYLAEQLESRGVRVGPRDEVFFGACYYRVLEIRGRELGLAVNGEGPLGWYLRIDRPTDGGTVEAEELVQLLDDILRGVSGLHSLKWQTEWESRNED
jgi:hypothetical protein